jgi:uridine kinase
MRSMGVEYSDLDQILEEICRGYHQSEKKSNNYIIGISGIDCAGKSTLIQQIEQNLTKKGIHCVCFSGDDFLMEQRIRNVNPDQAIGYYNESFDYKKLFHEILLPARSSLHLHQKITISDLLTDQMVETELEIQGPCVILVEGVFIFKRILPNVFDYKIWIDISFEEGLNRALLRPRDLCHYGSEEKIRNRYLDRLYKGQLLHLQIDRPLEICDAVMKSDLKVGIEKE